MKKTYSLAALNSICRQSDAEVRDLIIRVADATCNGSVVEFGDVAFAKGLVAEHFRAGGEIATFQLPPAWVAAGRKV